MDDGYELRDVSTSTETLLLKAYFPNFTPEALFDYLVTPELLSQWWVPEAEADSRLEGMYHFAWPQMNWHLRGQFTAFERGKHLAYTWKWDHEPDLPMRQVDILIEPEHDGTVITLTHGTYSDSDVDEDDRQSHLDGWRHFFGQLQQVNR